jgi:aldose 1-epimerase
VQRSPPVPEPSGRQFEIAFDEQRAVVVEVGGGLRTYSVGAREVVDGYGVEETPTAGRGQLLVPWPNRLQDGCYEFGGRRLELPLTEPERSNAIHGLVRKAPWRLEEQEPHRVLLEHSLKPQSGYPFSLDLAVEYELSADGLTVRMTATNAGVEACPYGAGAHPYLWPGSPSVDDAFLRLPAWTALEADARGIPTGAAAVDGTELDFREPRPIGTTQLDHCFTDLERDGDGRVRFVLTSPQDGTDVSLWADEAFEYVMVYTGDASPDVNRRSVAVEPMTCPPNAFRNGDALVTLEPGGSHTASWGLTLEAGTS